MAKQVISIRTNTSFHVQPDTNDLIPETEIILLVQKPVYKLGKSNIQKELAIEEFRFTTSTAGISELMGTLKLAEMQATKFEAMASSLNNVIEAYKEKAEPNPQSTNS